MMRNNALFTLFGLPVTPYALILCCGLLLGYGILQFRARRDQRDAALWFPVLAIPLGILFARLFWFTIGQNYSYTSLWDLQHGGFAIWGAMIGAALAAFLCGKITKLPFLSVLDLTAPSGALVIAFARFGEYFTGEGIGDYVENPSLQFFPLAIQDDYGDWQFAIFMAEGLVALMIFFVLLLNHARTEGNSTRLFLILYSSAQVILESLRRDNYLRWLFLRISQLMAVLALALLILIAILRFYRQGKIMLSLKRRLWIDSILFLLCVGLCVALEFAFDKAAWLSNDIGYLIMLFCCLLMGFSTYQISIACPKWFQIQKES